MGSTRAGDLALEAIGAAAGPAGERALLDALAGGDRDAAEELAARTYPIVFRVLCQLCHGDGARAADLVQETYRRAWASLDRFAGRAAFATWLCRIAYNAFLDEVRRNRESGTDPADLALADPGPRPGDALAEAEEHRALRRAVLGLPEELRFTVVARFWADAATADIARVERISEVAVRKRLRRALALLAETLEER